MVSEPTPSIALSASSMTSADLKAIHHMLREFLDEMKHNFAGIGHQLSGFHIPCSTKNNSCSSLSFGSSNIHRSMTEETKRDTSSSEFPYYDGSSDPTLWIYKVNQFFISNEIFEFEKVAMVSYYLYGDALRWYWNYIDLKPHITWPEFLNALQIRFGTVSHLDSHSAIDVLVDASVPLLDPLVDVQSTPKSASKPNFSALNPQLQQSVDRTSSSSSFSACHMHQDVCEDNASLGNPKLSHVVQSERMLSKSRKEYVILPGTVIADEESVSICTIGPGPVELQSENASVGPSNICSGFFSCGIENKSDVNVNRTDGNNKVEYQIVKESESGSSIVNIQGTEGSDSGELITTVRVQPPSDLIRIVQWPVISLNYVEEKTEFSLGKSVIVSSAGVCKATALLGLDKSHVPAFQGVEHMLDQVGNDINDGRKNSSSLAKLSMNSGIAGMSFVDPGDVRPVHRNSSYSPKDKIEKVETQKLGASNMNTSASNMVYEPSFSVSQYTSHDEWPVVDQATAGCGASLSEKSVASVVYADRSTSLSSHVNGVSLHHSLPIAEIYVMQGSVDGDIQGEDSTRLVTGSDTHKQMDNSDEESGLGGGPNDDMNSSQFQMQNIEHHEENAINMDVSSTAVSLQQLCLD